MNIADSASPAVDAKMCTKALHVIYFSLLKDESDANLVDKRRGLYAISDSDDHYVNAPEEKTVHRRNVLAAIGEPAQQRESNYWI